MVQMITESLEFFELHEKGVKQPKRIPAENDLGIELRVGNAGGALAYEGEGWDVTACHRYLLDP